MTRAFGFLSVFLAVALIATAVSCCLPVMSASAAAQDMSSGMMAMEDHCADEQGPPLESCEWQLLSATDTIDAQWQLSSQSKFTRNFEQGQTITRLESVAFDVAPPPPDMSPLTLVALGVLLRA